MLELSGWRRGVAVCAAGVALLLAGCNTPPAFQVSEPSAGRIGTVESITQDAVQNVNTTAGTVGGAVVGGLIGSQIGGGRGQTAATIIGAGGGAFVGNQAAQRSQTFVWRIGVRYEDGSLATIQQTTAPNLRVGDRVRVTSSGIQQL